MTAMAHTSDHVAEHLRLEWTAPDGADERAVAAEAIAALGAFVGSWFEPLAIEVRLGCYDREIFTEGDASLPNAHHLLMREPLPAGVEIRPFYRVVESAAPFLSGDAVWTWVEGTLAQSCGEATRFETSLRDVYVHASRLTLPPRWGDGVQLPLECYTGTITVPIDYWGDGRWIAAPPAPYGLYQPIVLSLDNVDGGLRFKIHVYWSPWVGELGRPESPLAQAVARLVARGWQPASD